MSRAERLLELMQCLRRHRYPLRGLDLAAELGVSLRTVYRDIASLQAQGAQIEGEPGLGYVLRPGFILPPLMFSVEEIEALVLGARWVARRTDSRLGGAARDALAKIGAVLPSGLRVELETSGMLVGPGQGAGTVDTVSARIRRGIRSERKVSISYRDLNGQTTRRTVWPFALAFFDNARVMVAWCELRRDYRHFRTDRIADISLLEERYPRRRHAMLREWREIRGISEQ